MTCFVRESIGVVQYNRTVCCQIGAGCSVSGLLGACRYEQIKGTGLANTCPRVEGGSASDSISISGGKSAVAPNFQTFTPEVLGNLECKAQFQTLLRDMRHNDLQYVRPRGL